MSSYKPTIAVEIDGETQVITSAKSYGTWVEAQGWLDGVHDSDAFCGVTYLTAVISEVEDAN